jgi:hypothetical protein
MADCVFRNVNEISYFSRQDRVTTENKELHLKMGLILEENARLKSILVSLQQHNVDDDDDDRRL